MRATHAYFVEQVERELSRARRYGQSLSLAIIDVDHFKHYNDRHGHPAGDAVLARLGDQQPRISISSGVASMRAGDTLEPLLERADQALYAAKNRGRNRVEVEGSVT